MEIALELKAPSMAADLIVHRVGHKLVATFTASAVSADACICLALWHESWTTGLRHIGLEQTAY